MLSLFNDLRDFEKNLDVYRTYYPFDLGAKFSANDSPNEYTVSLDIPGVPIEKVKISIDSNIVEIEAGEKTTTEYTDEGFRRTENRQRYYLRRLSIPEDADKDSLKAKLDNGVLVLSIQKNPETYTKKYITITR